VRCWRNGKRYQVSALDWRPSHVGHRRVRPAGLFISVKRAVLVAIRVAIRVGIRVGIVALIVAPSISLLALGSSGNASFASTTPSSPRSLGFGAARRVAFRHGQCTAQRARTSGCQRVVYVARAVSPECVAQVCYSPCAQVQRLIAVRRDRGDWTHYLSPERAVGRQKGVRADAVGASSCGAQKRSSIAVTLRQT
jgi:hypothetical protein